ncbi:MAG: hypothetical protein Q7S95_00515 [bacterium]|nr:hypothetical protein [bacterium]
MEIWCCRQIDDKQVWEKEALGDVFPRLAGAKGPIALDDWLWSFVLKSEEERYLIFTPEEEMALERLARLFTAGGSSYFLELLCANSMKYPATRAGKMVKFVSVYVDQPRKIGQECETRIAMRVRLGSAPT